MVAAISFARLATSMPLGPHIDATAQYDAAAIQNATNNIRFITLFTEIRHGFFTARH
jgi:hypothetical protein